MLEPPRKERLPRAVLAANRFEAALPRLCRAQFLIDCFREPIHPDRELFESAPRDRATPEGVDDLLPLQSCEVRSRHESP
jgi:hypothetical protein